MVGLEEWPYGVQGIINGRCIIFGPMVYRAFFYFLIPPYGVNGRCIIFGPMVYRAFFYFLIPSYGVNGRFMFFGPLVYRAFLILFRHTV